MEFDNNSYSYWLIKQVYLIWFQGIVNIKINLKEKEEDTNNPIKEENLSCSVVDDRINLRDILSTNYNQEYQFNTLERAHHATQALLELMVVAYKRWDTRLCLSSYFMMNNSTFYLV